MGTIGDVFGVAYAGMTAQRTAIEVTGENIANVSTEGYSRQQVNMETSLSIVPSGLEFGTGVQVSSIQRSYDNMLQQQLVTGSSTYQQNLTKQTALSQIEPAFNELNANGLGAAITGFFGSWQDLSNNPQGSAERQEVLSKSQVLVDNFHNVAKSLTDVAQVADQNLAGLTSEVSDLAKHLSIVNRQIVATQALGGNGNTFMDQRDLLVQKISEKMGITSTVQPDGTATVTFAGGQQLVSGADYATLYTQQNAATPPQNVIYATAVGNPPPASNPAADTDVTGTIGDQGQIGGTLQVRDVIVPKYLAKMDELASTLVSTVNAQHSGGYGLDGSTGNNFFDAAGTTAASISLDSALTANRIAAASTDPTAPGGGAANNVNGRAIADIKDASLAFSTGNDTITNFYSGQVSQIGIDVQSTKNVTSQGEAFLKQLHSLRESNSGVSLDEELTNLMKYQQAFQGAAKVMNTATDMFDSLLSLIR